MESGITLTAYCSAMFWHAGVINVQLKKKKHKTARMTLVFLAQEIIADFVVYPSNCHVAIILCDVGGGSTGVIQEPRHRPLLLVSYRTARIRELPPPADWPGH